MYVSFSPDFNECFPVYALKRLHFVAAIWCVPFALVELPRS